MQKRLAITCKSCKINFPVYYIGDRVSHSSTFAFEDGSVLCTRLKATERNDVDPLIGMRTRNKTHDLDDKIKNLRSELSSLAGEGSKRQAGNNNNAQNAKSGSYNNEVPIIKQVHKSYEGSISYSGGRVDVNVQYGVQKQRQTHNRSDKKEFTQWLDTTIDSLNGKRNSNNDKRKPIPPQRIVIPLSSKREGDRKNDSKITNKAKELLYESIVVKTYPCYVPAAEVKGVTAQPINLSKRKHEKTEESKHPTAKKTKTTDIKQKNPKVKTLVINDSSDSEVEIINIDDDSNGSTPVNNQVDDKKDKPKVAEIINNETTPGKGKTEKRKSCSGSGVWECPICFEQNTGQEVVATMCGHVFCKKCLDDYYVTYSKSCPTCRTDLQDKPVITLFNF